MSERACVGVEGVRMSGTDRRSRRWHWRRRSVLWAAGTFALAGTAGAARGASLTWTNGGSDFRWGNPANWTPAGVPSAPGDQAAR